VVSKDSSVGCRVGMALPSIEYLDTYSGDRGWYPDVPTPSAHVPVHCPIATCGPGERVRSKLSGANCRCLSRGFLERKDDHRYRSTGRDGPLTSIIQVSFEDEQFDT
jgi:hypothetical protein